MATQTYTPQTSSQPRGDVVRQIVNIFALGAVLTINALANIIPIGGNTTGELSDQYPSLFTPAGYVFSIWGLIYLLLTVFIIYQALPSQKDNPRLRQLGYAFAWSCLFNFCWIFAWHYEVIWLSELFMLGILASLILCYERLGIGKTEISTTEWFTTRLPFSVYLGWITVATVANTSVLLLELGAQITWVTPLWAALVIAVAVFIGYLVVHNRGDVPYTLVLAWAFFGIAVAQWGAEIFVVTAALLAALVMLALAVRQAFRGGGQRNMRSARA